MEYRKLPHGNELISVIGLGSGGIHASSHEEIVDTVNTAIDHGINFFDMTLSAGNPIPAYAEAFKGKRDKIYTQMHFGAHYPDGKYGWTRDMTEIKAEFDRQFKIFGFDYTDFGFVHCIDEHDDFDDIMRIWLWDYMKELKKEGVIRHLGFSSHNPEIARRFLDTGLIDLFMFSINPAYDYSHGKYALGKADERMKLYTDCEKMGVGISVMKPFSGGQLLDGATSPFGKELTKYQCFKYCLDKPAVLTVLPGVRCKADLMEFINYCDASEAEKDYSVIGKFTPPDIKGRCVYCNHCQPCPMGLDVGMINKYYDLAKAGDAMAANHYEKLSLHASDCVKCGHCESRCPFAVPQMARMDEIAQYFGK